MRKNVPDIRFKGFEDEWSINKLCSIADLVKNKNVDGSVILPLTVSAQYGLIAQEDFYNRRIAAKDISGYYVIKNGEFAYNRSTSEGCPFGAVKRLDKFNAGVLSTLYIVFKLKDQSVSSDFLVHYFNTDKWHSHIADCAAEGARNHGLLNISSKDFLDSPIIRPINIYEQKRIATFFTTLDNLISKLEEKLEKQRNIKQALLQNMFVDLNGDNSTPQIRLKGFNGDWEIHKLSYYIDVSYEINKNDEFDKNDIYSVSKEYGLVNQIEYQGKSFAGASLSNYGVVRSGDVVYTKSPLKNQPYGIIKTNKDGVGIVSPLYGVYRSTQFVNTDFVQVYFDYDSRLNEYLRPLVNKGAKNTLLISDKDSLEGIVVFPQLEEQEKMVSLFTTLDNLNIKLEQKIEKLRNIKQALLRKMFVQQ